MVEKFKNPFNIPLGGFRGLPFDSYAPPAEKAYRMRKERVEKLFKKEGVRRAVVFDGNVIYVSSNGIPGEVVNALMMGKGKLRYVSSKEDAVEEASWIKVNEVS